MIIPCKLVEYFFRSGEKERVNNLALAGKNTNPKVRAFLTVSDVHQSIYRLISDNVLRFEAITRTKLHA